jgi:dTMP kinase
VSAARWVALEGGEGSGKSTQAALLADAVDGVLTREPGGTAIGARLRDLLLDPGTGTLVARAEALLMAADRAQHVASVVIPALAAGRHVISDRSAWSFLAYQGYGRDLAVEDLWRLSDWAAGGRWPDLAVLIEVPPEESAARLAASGKAPDRLEAEQGGFHDRVRAGFLALAADHPTRWAVVDGSGPPAVVAARVRAAFELAAPTSRPAR